MAGGASSNADDIARKLEALGDSIRFDAEVGNKSLGRDMAGAVATGIADRSLADQSDPSGNGWDANRGSYGRAKRKAGLPIGVGLGRKKIGSPMLSLQELQGAIAITEEGRFLTVKYGTNPDNRRKADWFTNGSTGTDGEPSGAKNQPPRKFYNLDDNIRAELRKLAREHLRRVIAELRGK